LEGACGSWRKGDHMNKELLELLEELWWALYGEEE
jgi:hypothetical protein